MQNLSAPPIVLASSSRYRRELLQRLLDQFQSVAPGWDETPREGERPGDLVRRLSRSKAEAVAGKHRHALIIGADQVAVLGARILGKPGNHRNAVEQLLQSSGQTLSFLTAACILDPVTQQAYEHTDVTRVRFRRFDASLAEAYLAQDRPYDCAGSFRIEGAGFLLFESVTTGDPTALVGLPMIWLAGVLLELGYLQP
ncbi:MAG TPA: nucleoside triphosphate pyrophosphatase [Woeseiaceae bacterium]|nr:nucleoside triphosphate pyrophosphatase [Woeseiaceae bacterium]